MQKIVDLIDKQIEKENEIFNNQDLNKRMNFLAKFLNYLDNKEVYNITRIDIKVIIKVYLYSLVDEYSVEELENMADDLLEFFCHIIFVDETQSKLNEYLKHLDSLSLEEIEQYINYRNEYNKKFFKFNQSKNNPKFKRIFQLERQMFIFSDKNSGQIIEDFYYLFKKINNLELMKYICAALMYVCSIINFIMDAESFSYNQKYKRVLKDFEIEDLFGVLKSCNEKYMSLCNKMKKRRSDNTQTLEILKNALKKKENSFISESTILKLGDLDENFKNAFYKEVLKHNESIFKKMVEENRESKDLRLKFLIKAFDLYGFDFGKLDMCIVTKLIENGDLEEIEKKLNILDNKGKHLVDVEDITFTEILLDMNVDTLNERVKEIIKSNYPFDFIRDNFRNLLAPEIIDLINGNIALCQNYKINILYLFSNCPKILFWETDELRNKLESLKKLGIVFDESISNFYAIYSPEFYDVYMTFLCILGDKMQSNFDIISENFEFVLKRIMICELLGVSIFNNNGKVKKSIVTGNKFIVADADLDDYFDSSLSQYFR